MGREIKLRQAGGSVSATLPGDLVERFHLAAGDKVIVVGTDRGILLSPYDPVIEKSLALVASAGKKYRHAFRELAK